MCIRDSENTLYYNQKLSDILNMNSGDHKYIEAFEFVNSKELDEKFRGSLDDHMLSLKQYFSQPTLILILYPL